MTVTYISYHMFAIGFVAKDLLKFMCVCRVRSLIRVVWHRPSRIQEREEIKSPAYFCVCLVHNFFITSNRFT